jgi:beta-galactosidase GanA
LNSGVFWDYSKRIVTELAKATGGHEQLVAWQIDSGVGGHTTEFSFNEETRNDWHAWLQAKYETVENLNDCMGGRFWGQLVNDFSEVPMPQRAPTVHNPALVLRSSMVAFSLIPAKEIRGFIVKSSRSAKKSNCWIRSSRDPKSRLRPAFFTHMIMPGV